MGDHRERATTRADVARLAGVSTAVVSYVVNDGPRGVSARTRERVLRAIRELDYRPNPNARALKTGTTGLMGVVVSDITNPHYAEFVEAIDSAAAVGGRSVLLGISHGQSEGESGIIRSLLNRGIDGLVIVNCRLTEAELVDLGALDKPCVLVDRSLPTETLPTVGSDLAMGARLATEHLVGHGHERIVYVGGPLLDSQVDHRRAAFEDVLAQRGLPRLDPLTTPWTREGGHEAAQQLLSRPSPPTAVFAGSDLIAIGLMNGAQGAGCTVPDDLAVASFDGTKESHYVSPSLTTVRQSLDLIAEQALDLLNGSEGKPQHQTFPVELVVRSSCGC